MKVKTRLETYSTDLTVSKGMVTITDDYSIVGIEEIKGLDKIKGIYVKACRSLEFDFIRDDGWEVSIGTQPYDNEALVVTRFYRKPNGDIDWDTYKQYLTKNGKWKKGPKNASLPNDAVRIPLSALVSLEEEKVKV